MAAAIESTEAPWQAACALHTMLVAGYALECPPPPVPDLLPEVGEQVIGVFYPGPGEHRLDYARWLADDVVVTSGGPALVMGSPQFVAGYAFGSLAMRARTRRKARRLAQPQWRQWPMTCAVVTSRRLWCEVPGQGWRHFGYSHVTNARLDGTTLLLEFTREAEPLRLDGPWAPWIAVAIAHHRFGPEATRALPWLARMHRATMTA